MRPHIVHTREAAGELGAYDYAVAARALELLSRREVARWGRDFDVLVTPTSAILPPVAGATMEAQHAAPWLRREVESGVEVIRVVDLEKRVARLATSDSAVSLG